jgi:hypothetical protein
MSPVKTCQQCGQILHGRLDKKFCDDQCRSHFNNLLNCDVSSTMRNINYILRKNRRILSGILQQSEKGKVNKETLIESGFNFKHFTHYYQNSKGRIFKVCYDFAYSIPESDLMVLLNLKNRKKKTILNTIQNLVDVDPIEFTVDKEIQNGLV